MPDAVERRIRKVVSYVCTDCFLPFPDNTAAKAHWKATHYVPRVKRPRGRPPKKAPATRSRTRSR